MKCIYALNNFKKKLKRMERLDLIMIKGGEITFANNKYRALGR
jgi:hypothetical protein